MPPIPSPCIQVCTLDPAGRRCVGCGRTLDEIARWPSMSAPERAAILERLAASVLPALSASLPTWSEGTDGA